MPPWRDTSLRLVRNSVSVGSERNADKAINGCASDMLSISASFTKLAQKSKTRIGSVQSKVFSCEFMVLNVNHYLCGRFGRGRVGDDYKPVRLIRHQIVETFVHLLYRTQACVQLSHRSRMDG